MGDFAEGLINCGRMCELSSRWGYINDTPIAKELSRVKTLNRPGMQSEDSTSEKTNVELDHVAIGSPPPPGW